MGQSGHGAQPSAQPDGSMWLFRTAHQEVDGAWVYQALRGYEYRSVAEKYGILPWDTLPGVKQVASDYMSRERTAHAVIGITVKGRWYNWALPCPQPPVPGMVKPLDAGQMAEYQRLLADALTGPEQKAMQERDPQAYKAWLDTQLEHVPMPSEQKPDINGFREGDRVRLVKPFRGETVSYEPGRTGTFLITDTAPAQIRLAREGFYEVAIDGPDGRFIGVGKEDVEKIPGRVRVIYHDDYVSFAPAD